MSKTIIAVENIETGAVEYLGGPVGVYTSNKDSAAHFIGESVMVALKSAKSNVNPNVQRVYTLSA
tara:strand:- start:77 stop:271 length:195 start_codon:yes stop_codon:yes gene_type:complete